MIGSEQAFEVLTTGISPDGYMVSLVKRIDPHTRPYLDEGVGVFEYELWFGKETGLWLIASSVSATITPYGLMIMRGEEVYCDSQLNVATTTELTRDTRTAPRIDFVRTPMPRSSEMTLSMTHGRSSTSALFVEDPAGSHQLVAAVDGKSLVVDHCRPAPRA